MLDLRPLKVFTDWFVVCHGTSTRHALTIADGIEERLQKTLRRSPGHVEGRRTAEWILLDYIDFVVHVYTAERRAFYGLERLWGDAARVPIPGEAEPPAAAKRAAPAARRRRAKSPS